MMRPKWWIIATNIADNVLFQVRSRLGWFDTIHGATHYRRPTDESVRYIETVFRDYLSYSGLKPSDLAGKRILEVGPGDNYGVASLFLAWGASQVVCLDRFRSAREQVNEQRIYASLRDGLEGEQRAYFDRAVSLDDGVQYNPERLKAFHGVAIEDADRILEPGTFDLIVSRAVLMEIADPERSLLVMDRLLRPGGVSIHKVAPLNDYRMFRQHGYHPLEFLTIPDMLYRRMTDSSGKPNRHLRSYYETQFLGLKYDTAIHTVTLLGESGALPTGTVKDRRDRAIQLLDKIRARLPKRYRDAPSEDLITEDLFIVAKKPPVCTTRRQEMSRV